MPDSPQIASAMQEAANAPFRAPRSKSVSRAAKREARHAAAFRDSFQNFAARLGQGTDNQSSFGTYGFNPITRIRLLLDFAYRGSWICRTTVKAIADDMTREGIDLGSDFDKPTDKEALQTALQKKFTVWDKLSEGAAWGRLYGGALAVMLIDGQDPSRELRLDTIGKGDFCGLEIVDRWMVTPSLNDLVTDLRSNHRGKPKYYTVNADAPVLARHKVHHSRVIRFDGDDLPYYQSITENLWSLSVLEPIFDRIMSFDSTTAGTAQLVYRASLRNLYIEGLREIIANGGKRFDAMLEQVDMMRRFQSIEGITLMDAKDRFEALQYTFTGLDAVLIQMGQQISGATGIPLVRLFGQSPVGLNSTGESDLRFYYDGIKSRQERDLRPGLEWLIRVIARSEQIELPRGFAWTFVPLWQLTSEQKVQMAGTVTSTVSSAFEAGLVSQRTALEEMRESSRETGIWGNISDEDIQAASEAPGPQQQGMPPGLGEESGEGESGGAAPPPPPPDFLPGRAETQPEHTMEADEEPDSFLPGEGRRLRKWSILGAGQSPVEETDAPEQRERRHHGPIVSLHTADRDRADGTRSTSFAGFRVVVEVEKGQPRFEGSSRGAIMAAPYGYFPDTVGDDGDSIDVFLGDEVNSQTAYILDQGDPDTGKYHQQKVFLGFSRPTDVVDVFTKFYADGRGYKRLLRGTQMTLPELRSWLEKRSRTHGKATDQTVHSL